MKLAAKRLLPAAALAALLALVAILPVVPAEVLAAEGDRITLGRITSEPRKHFERMRAMADFLARELAAEGVTGVDIIMVDSEIEMEARLAAGEVDIISETPFMALSLEDKGLVDILLREWKKGVAQYHSVIIVRKDSPVKRLEDLVDRRIAFEDPGSTSGYMMPRVALESAGLSLYELADPRETVAPGRVGYSFAQGEVNIAAWVNRGLTEAGAFSNQDWDDPKAAPELFKDELVVIHRTKPVVRSTLLVRSGLDSNLKSRIVDILTDMHESAEGRKVLKAYFKVARYDRFEGEALAGLEAAREIWLRANGRIN